MPKITVDITGFYFAIKVDVDEQASVLDAMTAAAAASRGTDAELYFESQPRGEVAFLRKIAVDHKIDPSSRQDPRRKRPAGFYEYDDSIPTNTFFSLVWQYYIFNDKKIIQNGVRSDNSRKIVPYSETNEQFQQQKPILFKDGYTVLWRLVTICTQPGSNKIHSLKTNPDLLVS